MYKPRRRRASPLYRLVEAPFPALHAADDERFAETYGAGRPVMRKVTERYLACGILEHGFARVRCGTCAHEHLLASSWKCRYVCPNCLAKSDRIKTVDRALAMDVTRDVPGHGFIEEPRVARSELVTVRKALVEVIAEVQRLHGMKLSVDEGPPMITRGLR